MNGLTRRQAQLLDVVRAYMAQHGRAPTWREIGDRMGIASTNGVHDHMKALRRKGYLEWDDRVARSLRVPNAMTLQVAQDRLRELARELEDAADQCGDVAFRERVDDISQRLYGLACAMGGAS